MSDSLGAWKQTDTSKKMYEYLQENSLVREIVCVKKTMMYLFTGAHIVICQTNRYES